MADDDDDDDGYGYGCGSGYSDCCGDVFCFGSSFGRGSGCGSIAGYDFGYSDDNSN